MREWQNDSFNNGSSGAQTYTYPAAGTWIQMKVKVQQETTAIKIWTDGDAEPAYSENTGLSPDQIITGLAGVGVSGSSTVAQFD